MTDDLVAGFEPHRPHLFAVAYRMLGSVSDAEDVVQDAFLRWTGAARDGVESPRAFLTRTVTRLCLDRRGTAAARRETYPGPWLPEPLVEPAPPGAGDELSVALLLALERLSPLERAAFLLHDVFDLDFAEIAVALDRSEPAVRQLAARARAHVRDARPRFPPTTDAAARIAAAFGAAVLTGDVAALTRLLAADATLYSDGGGKRSAALRPILGRDKVVRFLLGVARKRGARPPDAIRPAWVSGLPGYVITTPDGVETLAIAVDGEAIAAIYIVRNPDKLGHLAP